MLTSEPGRCVAALDGGAPCSRPAVPLPPRARAAVEQAIPGAGLGRAIVEAIADAHRGAVTVESAESRGTTVRVELPGYACTVIAIEPT